MNVAFGPISRILILQLPTVKTFDCLARMPNLLFVTSWIMRARIVLRYIPAFATAKPAFHRTIALTSFAPLTLPQIRFQANWSLEYSPKKPIYPLQPEKVHFCPFL